MSRRWQRLSARSRAVAGGDRGMTTAEYAVGTVAACGFGGLLYKILTSDSVMHLLEGILNRAFHFGF